MGPCARRLYIRLPLAGRQRCRNLESCLDQMTVSSILEEAFVGDPFPGHDRINHTLADLTVIVSQQRPDWRIALEHMRGVHVDHGHMTGARYVGSACRFVRGRARRYLLGGALEAGAAGSGSRDERREC
jgi:hypothetical protein